MKKIKFCCDRFKEYVAKRVIKRTKDRKDWTVGKLPFLVYCPFCSKFIPSKEVPEEPHYGVWFYSLKRLDKFLDKNSKYCCGRFKESVKEGKISYAYKSSRELDETQWIMTGGYHIYYCPFCGKNVKGRGNGPVLHYTVTERMKGKKCAKARIDNS